MCLNNSSFQFDNLKLKDFRYILERSKKRFLNYPEIEVNEEVEHIFGEQLLKPVLETFNNLNLIQSNLDDLIKLTRDLKEKSDNLHFLIYGVSNIFCIKNKALNNTPFEQLKGKAIIFCENFQDISPRVFDFLSKMNVKIENLPDPEKTSIDLLKLYSNKFPMEIIAIWGKDTYLEFIEVFQENNLTTYLHLIKDLGCKYDLL